MSLWALFWCFHIPGSGDKVCSAMCPSDSPGDCTVTSVSIKLDLSEALVSKFCPHCSSFLCFLYASFQTDTFVVPETSPKFRAELLWLLVVFFLNINHSVETPIQRGLWIPSTHSIYTHTPIISWYFLCQRWTLQTPSQIERNGWEFKNKASALQLNLRMTGVNIYGNRLGKRLQRPTDWVNLLFRRENTCNEEEEKGERKSVSMQIIVKLHKGWKRKD